MLFGFGFICLLLLLPIVVAINSGFFFNKLKRNLFNFVFFRRFVVAVVVALLSLDNESIGGMMAQKEIQFSNAHPHIIIFHSYFTPQTSVK